MAQRPLPCLANQAPASLAQAAEDGAAGVTEHHIDLVGADEHLVEDLRPGFALETGLGGHRGGGGRGGRRGGGGLDVAL